LDLEVQSLGIARNVEFNDIVFYNHFVDVYNTDVNRQGENYMVKVDKDFKFWFMDKSLDNTCSGICD